MKRSTPRFSTQAWDKHTADVDPVTNAFDLHELNTTPDDSELTITPIEHLVEEEEDAIDRLLSNSGFERTTAIESSTSNAHLQNPPISDDQQAAFRVEPIPEEPDDNELPVNDDFKVESFLRDYLATNKPERPSSIVPDSELAKFIPIENLKSQHFQEESEQKKMPPQFADESMPLVEMTEPKVSEASTHLTDVSSQAKSHAEEASSAKAIVNVADASIRFSIVKRSQRNRHRHESQAKHSRFAAESLDDDIKKEITLIEKQLLRTQKQLNNTTQLSYAILAFTVLIFIANAVLFIKLSTINLGLNKLTEWVVMLKEDFENPLAEKQPEP